MAILLFSQWSLLSGWVFREQVSQMCPRYMVQAQDTEFLLLVGSSSRLGTCQLPRRLPQLEELESEHDDGQELPSQAWNLEIESIMKLPVGLLAA
mmetsp:Transcript_30468/g.98212  ORF Transcript_30468/g.98212 Transcript_30468/m.98212 type:complete len:95 (-) Transcript_30468:149-433(-)